MVTDPRSSPLPSSFYLLRHDLRLELAASKQLALALASDSLPRPTLFEAPQRVDWTLLTQFYLVLTAVSTRSVRSSQARSPSAIVVASSLLALDRNQVFLFHPVRSDSGDLNELHGHCSRPTESFRSQPVSAKSESVFFLLWVWGIEWHWPWCQVIGERDGPGGGAGYDVSSPCRAELRSVGRSGAVAALTIRRRGRENLIRLRSVDLTGFPSLI